MSIDLRCGRWEDVLADVALVDALITDPPYGENTHDATNEHVAGSALPDGSDRMAIDYAHWTPDDVWAFVRAWSPRVRGWFACMTSDDLIPVWKAAYREAGLYPFAPVPIIQPRPRLVGDGPASWTVHLCAARPRSREFATWGCLPGAYRSHTDRTGIVAGAKPVSLMREIVRDYSREGDLVCDPCAGGASTLIAAHLEGRRAVGSERDAIAWAKAQKRIDGEDWREGEQGQLFAEAPWS